MLPSRLGEHVNPIHVRVQTSLLSKLEKLQYNMLITHYLVVFNQWNTSLWSLNQFIETNFQFGNYVLRFLGAISKHVPKFQTRWFGPYRIQYCLPNNIILLLTIDKFDPNPILVNINKLKPYRFIEDIILQPILANLSDVVVDEHVQT
jgi:hypothetical protein